MGRNLAQSVRQAIWDGYDAGRTFGSIAGIAGCSLPAAWREVRRHGGIRPAGRRRSPRQLQAEEREQISRGLAMGWPLRGIAARLVRPVCTISREVARNGGREAYRAAAAEQRAWGRARRSKLCKLQRSARLREAVQRRLCWRWSPQQIAADLKRCHPQDAAMQVSHESIYRSLFIQARGALKEELIAHLRRGGRYRRRQHAQLPQRPAAGPIPDAISIRERPAEAEDRAVPGHWEGDLIVGSHGSSIATLVERQSR
jgi:IS30 family transposase